MTGQEYFNYWFNEITFHINSIDNENLVKISSEIIKSSNNSGKIIIVGNGGSAAIASHVSIDLTKASGVRAINFNEGSLLTCFSNDYGYENWVQEALGFYAESNDLVILISSSGQSNNIINGAKKALEMNLPLITLSGFSRENPLKKMGKINLWVDSSKYNIVESVHQSWLLSVVDYLIINK